MVTPQPTTQRLLLLTERLPTVDEWIKAVYWTDVVAERVILLTGLLEMEQRRRGAETELGYWLGVRGWSDRKKCEGKMMVTQR